MRPCVTGHMGCFAAYSTCQLSIEGEQNLFWITLLAKRSPDRGPFLPRWYINAMKFVLRLSHHIASLRDTVTDCPCVMACEKCSGQAFQKSSRSRNLSGIYVESLRTRNLPSCHISSRTNLVLCFLCFCSTDQDIFVLLVQQRRPISHFSANRWMVAAGGRLNCS